MCFRKYRKNMIKPLKEIPFEDIIRECYDIDLNFTSPIAKVIYNYNNTIRAVILHRNDDTFRIHYEKLLPFDEDELKYAISKYHGFWSPIEMSGIIDTVGTAEKIISENVEFKL